MESNNTFCKNRNKKTTVLISFYYNSRNCSTVIVTVKFWQPQLPFFLRKNTHCFAFCVQYFHDHYMAKHWKIFHLYSKTWN